MENLLISLGLIILITILFMVVIDYKLFRKIIKFKRQENELLISDEKYYELNYKIQLLIASSSIILIVGGFLGYSSISSISADFVENVKEYKEKLEIYDSLLIKYKNAIVEIDSQNVRFRKILNISVRETERLKSGLVNLQKEFSPTIKTFIIKNIGFEIDKAGTVKVYYKDLRTIDGSKLPIFNEPPILTILSSGTTIIHIVNTNTEYFEYIKGLYLELEDKEVNGKNNKFDLMITKYK